MAGLNVLIDNAGIQRPENLLNQQEDLADAESTITTNLLGPIRLTATQAHEYRSHRADSALCAIAEVVVEQCKPLRFASERGQFVMN